MNKKTLPTAQVIYGAPGTGKTTFLMNLCENLEENFFASQILFLSFTRAARDEVLLRNYKTKKVLKKDKNKVNPKTVHGLAYSLVAEASPETIVEKRKLAKFRTEFNVKRTSDDLLEIIQRAGTDDKVLIPFGREREYKKLVKTYYEWKAANGYIDFNDVLRLFMERRFESLKKYRVLIVDEAQDLTPLQWEVIRYLIDNYSFTKVYIAGDDDQAIYAWAGADSQGMLDFERAYNAEKVILDKSYRLPEKIKKLADQIINRIPKTNRVPKVFDHKSEAGEVESFFAPAYVPLNADEEIMILYRENSSRQFFEKQLQKKALPYISTDGFKTWFDDNLSNAIRAYKKLERGEKITEDETKLIKKYVKYPDYNPVKDFNPLLSLHEAFSIPFERLDYYEKVSLDAKPKIRLSTIHCAKGQEADTVILYSGIGKKTMKNMYKTQKFMDDETRVFYVGITRAKKKLQIVKGERNFPVC